jgi:hypothetical protein
MKKAAPLRIVLCCLVPSLLMSQGSPTEAQCRGMIDGMVQSMKSAPLGEKDRQSARELIDRVEKLVRDNRARGVSECGTWAGVAKLISTQ